MERPATILREAFAPGDPVTLDEAAQVLDGERARASQALTHLVGQGTFVRVRRQLWVRAGAPADRYRLGSRVTAPSAFAYGTALALHGGGAADRTEVLISAPHRFDAFEHDGLAYRRALPWSDQGIVRVSVGPEFVSVTSRARTLVDCVRVPANAGGFAELLRGAAALGTLEPGELLAAVDRYGESSLAARVGFMLDAIGRENSALLDELERRRPAARFYLEPARRGGELVARWNMIVPSHLLPVPRAS